MGHHVKEEYGIEYHENYAYELLREVVLSARTARPQHNEADPKEKAEFQQTVKKTARTERKNGRRCRSIHKHVRTIQRREWCPIGSNPTIETATSWESVTVLDAITDDGGSFFCWTEENLTRKHGIRLLETLKERFGEERVVFLDRAGYFEHEISGSTSAADERPKLSETVRSRAYVETIWKSETFIQSSLN